MSAVFRLYTETRDNLARLTTLHFSGATFYPATGLWQGETEPATVIEVIATVGDTAEVLSLARRIARENQQSEVLVTSVNEMGRLSVYHVDGKDARDAYMVQS